jgi:hypothetical protein
MERNSSIQWNTYHSFTQNTDAELLAYWITHKLSHVEAKWLSYYHHLLTVPLCRVINAHVCTLHKEEPAKQLYHEQISYC